MADQKSKSAGPVWAKRVGDQSIAEVNVRYCAGRDVSPRPACDLALIEHDLATNAAHAVMLAEQDILSDVERTALLGALVKIQARHQAGETILRPECEDVHMSIESMVTEIAGPGAGGRLHTGRSRNDQVATDMAQWLREELATLGEQLGALANALALHAREHAEHVCPGLTHMQPGMISTWGHAACGYLARVVRDLRSVKDALNFVALCPLGAAASFGTSWPINRERTAELLGFDGPTPHSADSIWSRGEAEARFAFAAAQVLGHLSGIGQDLILFSSPPRTWLRLPDAFVTGSSIMPQKRNPDFAEVTRAKASVVAGIVQSLLGISTAAAGGYNRDTQWTKYLIMDAAAEVEGAPSLFAKVFEGLEVNAAEMEAACAEGFLNATDVADMLARTRGLPFRDCYRVLGRAVQKCEREGQLTLQAINEELATLEEVPKPLSEREMATLTNPVELLKQRSQTGSPHPDKVCESVAKLEAEGAALAGEIEARASVWRESIAALWNQAKS